MTHAPARMRIAKRWQIAAVDARAGELAGRLKISSLIAQLLLNRGIESPEDAGRFLRPTLGLLHDPALLAGVTKASDRIARAIRDGEKVVIFGDYDVDGITASAILWHAIHTCGGVAETYVPHRIDEGYGLNTAAIETLIDGGAKLIVTVDCGITAVEPVAAANARGVDVVVTDHHEWHFDANGAAIFPDAHAIVHPKLAVGGGWEVGGGEEESGSQPIPSHLPPPTSHPPYPNPNLCGAGVALKLAWALGQSINGASKVSPAFRAFLLEAVALAALGTIADVVPLVGENRVLASYGLGHLKETTLTGLRALIDSAGLNGQKLDSYDVGFKLAPRLNACGRMGHARLAVELLTTADDAKAAEIAEYLEQQNRVRQATEKKTLEEALAQAIELGFDDETSRAVVLGSGDWHAGVIGIVASRVVERFGKPAVLVALANGEGAGSGRSVAGFHLARGFAACGDHLIKHGGHEMAAGLKVATEKFEGFREAFVAHANETIDVELLVPTLKIDATAELRDFTGGLVHDLQRLAPFGQGNRRPTFAVMNVTLAGPPKCVGKTGDHVQLYVRDGDTHMKCIAFGLGKCEIMEQLVAGTRIDLAVVPSINEWEGRVSVELEVRDVRMA